MRSRRADAKHWSARSTNHLYYTPMVPVRQEDCQEVLVVLRFFRYRGFVVVWLSLAHSYHMTGGIPGRHRGQARSLSVFGNLAVGAN